MLSAQGPAHDPNTIRVLIVLLAIMLVLWWRVALVVLGILLVIVFGFGAMALLHDIHHAVR